MNKSNYDLFVVLYCPVWERRIITRGAKQKLKNKNSCKTAFLDGTA